MATRKKETSYVETHNRAVERFRKASRILIWAGIFNVLGLAIGIVQVTTGVSDTLPFYFCFGVVNLLFNSLIVRIGNIFWEFTIVIVIAMVFSIGAILLSVYASQGRRKPLIIATGIYFLDWIVVLVTYFLALDNWQNLVMSCGFHIIISGCLAYAIYQYFNVINIEKRFVNKPVEEENIEAKGE
ncbi:MAG: hypothetical protein MJ248_05910 [Bacilli bacterium]|nr:hypothetical protein [Bacilli bacterium]